jgi:hypothetical protein
MAPAIILLLIIGVPIALLILLRINAAIVFLSLCLGSVLVQFVAGDVKSIISGASLHAQTSDSTIKLILLFLPAVLTAAFMIKTVRSKRVVFNVLPAIGTGLLTALLAIPLLPPALGADITSQDIWYQVQRSQSLIVGLSAAISLLFLWLQRPKASPKEHGKHKA